MQRLVLLFFVSRRLGLSACGLDAADTQIVIMKDRVEEKRETSVRLMPPHWVISEHNYVSLPYRHINNGSLAYQFRPAGEHSAHQQIFLSRRESQYDTRPGCERRYL